MHPTVMTIIADDRAERLRAEAARHRRPVAPAPRRRFTLRLPLFVARTGS